MTWKFDSTVAATFVEHARQHIPNYDLVIDKCVDVCCNCLAPDSAIVDVGCATGETLNRLHAAGFNNLTGVESSQDMLDYCDDNIARILHSDSFPQQEFDAVLCNWTLHFIEEKYNYLTDIYQNLTPNGFLVLSEKTSLDPEALHFYHLWKNSNGVSWEEIHSKEQAIKDIMYINDVNWYLSTLSQIGFTNIRIIDANWCFTTFLCDR